MVAEGSRLGRYFLGHALDVFDSMGADPRLDDARTVLDWIARDGCSIFTRRELFNGVRGSRFPKVTDVSPALTVLVDHGYIRRLDALSSGPSGGRPSTRYEAHPIAAKPAEPAKP